MGNGFNDADRLGTRGWKGGALAVLQKAPGTTNAQKAAAEELRVRNDVGVPRDLAAVQPDEFKAPLPKARRKQKVLDEDVYTASIEKIIRRDFFPELSVLEAQAAYLAALEEDDDEALRLLAKRFGTPARGSTAAPATPAGWETPSVAGSPRRAASPCPFDSPGSHSAADGDETSHDTTAEGEADTSMSLDQFLTIHTSEDNESFEKLMEKYRERLLKKHEWLYRKAHDQKKQLALTAESTARKVKELEHGMQMPIEGWHYTPKNALMYQPEARAVAIPAKIDKSRSKPQSVAHANTRFAVSPFIETNRSTGGATGSTIAPPTSEGSADSPRVNGYGFVVTPSPHPGVDLDPTMTWGFIDGTPFRLDPKDAADVASGPIFKLPNRTPREKAEEKMQDEAARRARKRAANDDSARTPAQRVRRNTPGSTATRLAAMSPAAQRLGKHLLKNRAGVLSSAYSGTPRATPRSTPLRGAVSTPLSTPRGTVRTPRHVATASVTSISAGSLTDGLL